jgi:hypothetical protein
MSGSLNKNYNLHLFQVERSKKYEKGLIKVPFLDLDKPDNEDTWYVLYINISFHLHRN